MILGVCYVQEKYYFAEAEGLCEKVIEAQRGLLSQQKCGGHQPDDWLHSAQT